LKKESQEETPIVIDTEATCDAFCEEEELPALKTMFLDLFGLGWRTVRAFVGGKKTLSSDKEANERWSVCLDCEHLLKKKRCSQCGCYMKYKIHVAEAECPIGKWGASNNKP
tara:strand:+ start:4 stop:339 length:336 start_codon:yes stop_codon:yes gene_type:complete